MRKVKVKSGDDIIIRMDWNRKNPVATVTKEFVNGVEVMFSEDGRTKVFTEKELAEIINSTTVGVEDIRTTPLEETLKHWNKEDIERLVDSALKNASKVKLFIKDSVPEPTKEQLKKHREEMHKILLDKLEGMVAKGESVSESVVEKAKDFVSVMDERNASKPPTHCFICKNELLPFGEKGNLYHCPVCEVPVERNPVNEDKQFDFESEVHVVKMSSSGRRTVAQNVVIHNLDDMGEIESLLKYHKEKDENPKNQYQAVIYVTCKDKEKKE